MLGRIADLQIAGATAGLEVAEIVAHHTAQLGVMDFLESPSAFAAHPHCAAFPLERT
jgi:hypothetical protein